MYFLELLLIALALGTDAFAVTPVSYTHLMMQTAASVPKCSRTVNETD